MGCPDLPADRHVIEAADDVAFTDDEVRGTELALEQHRNGQTIDASKARQIFDALLKR